MVRAVPIQLRGRPFTLAEGLAAGLSRQTLRGRRFWHPHIGVFVHHDVEPTLSVRIRAARLILPSDAAVSHQTRLQQLGIDVGSSSELHFSTNSSQQIRRPGIVVHRRIGRLHPVDSPDGPALGPDRTFVDAATTLRPVDLVIAGDWLVKQGLTTLAVLTAYVMSSHLDGVLRARRWAALVRERVDSPMETIVRLMLLFARLPEPEPNLWLGDEFERVGRCDLVYLRWKVVIEYNGRWHDEDPFQAAADEIRRARFEALGWRVIVVKAKHLSDKREIVLRVHHALVEHGYDGPALVFDLMWTRWFGR